MHDDAFGFVDSLGGDLRRYRLLTRNIAVDAPLKNRDRLRLVSPRLIPNLLIRSAHSLATSGLGPLAKLLSFINFTLFGIEVAIHCRIGPGLFLPHTQGSVLGASRIGSNVTIYHGVTLGARTLDFGFEPDARPVIENDVIIGAGAKVLGGIIIGQGSRIGPNAVVIDTLPSGARAFAPVAQTTRPVVQD